MNQVPDEEIGAYLTAVIETAVEAIIIIDEQGLIQTFNPAAERLFGYPATEVLDQNIKRLMPAPYKHEHDDYLSNYLAGGTPRIIGIGREALGQKKDGSTFPISLSVSEVRTRDRRAFVGIVRDLSELRELQNALVNQSERERAEIGQDLHDVLAQQLTALSLLCKTLEKRLRREESDSTTLAEEIVELSKRAMDEARRLAHGLYPTELEHRGLIAALHELAENSSRLWKVDCRVVTSLDRMDLPHNTGMHLYRIAQEATSNAVKHGRADRIRIRLSRDEDGLALEIQDDGSGFESGEQRGMGLLIMRHRANLIKATLDISSESGQGVRVSCILEE